MKISDLYHRILSVAASGVLAAVLVAGCSVAEGSRGAQESMGTIRAAMDGEQRTWHALEAMIEGQRETSVFWTEEEDGTRSVVLGGYDRVDVPFDTFERDPESGMVISYGDFDGGLLVLTFDVPPGASAPLSFSASEGDDPSIVLAPSMTDPVMLSLEGGRIHVETIDFDQGRFEGTFEADLRTMDGSGTVEITDGRFEVEGGRSFEDITSGGP